MRIHGGPGIVQPPRFHFRGDICVISIHSMITTTTENPGCGSANTWDSKRSILEVCATARYSLPEWEKRQVCFNSKIPFDILFLKEAETEEEYETLVKVNEDATVDLIRN